MTSNSLISNYMVEHIHWRDELKTAYNINISEDGNLAIFNYGVGADFSEPIVQEARGIIIDTQTHDVVCWPFRKFGNWNELYADEIDWEYAWAVQKIDGSLIKLYWHPYDNCWTFATNGVINARNSDAGATGMSFYDVITKAQNYGDIDFNLLDKNFTYMFELVSPWTQVVIKYAYPKLYHIGTRSKITGNETMTDIGVEQPERMKFDSLDGVINNVNHMNMSSIVTDEGYVVVDRNWHRVKVKSPKYLIVHSMLGNRIHSKKRIVHNLMSDKVDIDYDLMMTVQNKFYDYELAELTLKVDIFINYVRALYDEVSQDRYAVYEAIKDHPLAQFGLKAIDNDYTAEGLVKHMYKSRSDAVLKMIDDYEFDYSSVLKG